jgi:hypothetical protein
MSKRSRGARPGRQRPQTRPAPQRPATGTAPSIGRPAALTAEEEARAAELESQIVAEERAADDARLRNRDRARTPDAAPRGRTREGSLLANRAAEEYTYVVRDVRRIIQVGGGLLVVLLALWLVLEVIKPF